MFGRSAARRLVELGAEVIAVDHSEEAVAQVQDMVTRALVAESTDKDTLKAIIDEFHPDGVVICFGESFDATMTTVVYLKEFGVDYIVARASSIMQGEILRRLGVKNIVLPEAVMGQRVADSIVLGESEGITLDAENSIVRVRLPKSAFGKRLSELEPQKHGITPLFVHREYLAHKVSKLIPPDEDPELEEGDNLVVLGSPRRIAKFVAKLL